ncbi:MULTISPECIES: acyltransferase family protein [Clostridium]|uniref:Acyltransferase 3 n=1 Tax=Clostridium disporicum TaxID=84024 RepID=A0A174IWT6_9CLOT|nr:MULTISPECIES: acyltransferase family protein [Clostridium]MDU7454063.1 acyltransferase family protein [Clostridium saudiense]CUO90067.1 acyltransferase 3 [Clostridium disporicum]SCJ90884.1 Acyltransferase family [uncultured Clostridium sp.]
MELTKNQIKITKGVAILFMLLLHLFCTKNYEGLYIPILFIGEVPLMYYLALFGDCCVAIYCFCSGYGLFISYKNNKEKYLKNNLIRIFKLYINYWIILLIFVVILGPLMGMGNSYPGSLKKFLLSFLAIEPAYNGAWWFLTTYIILVLISQFINKLVNKYNNITIVLLSLVFYFVAYIQRIRGIITLNNEILDWGISQIALLGTSQFPFIVGAIFAKHKIYSKLFNMVNRVRYKNILCIFIIGLMLVAHGIVQSLFVAVFTGIVFICVFNLMDKPKWINSTLNYLGNHSTNMWLIHMFFYSIYFRQLIWSVKYSLFIYSLLVVLCVVSSYIINLIYNPIIRAIDKKIKNQKAGMVINI